MIDTVCGCSICPILLAAIPAIQRVCLVGLLRNGNIKYSSRGAEVVDTICTASYCESRTISLMSNFTKLVLQVIIYRTLQEFVKEEYGFMPDSMKMFNYLFYEEEERDHLKSRQIYTRVLLTTAEHLIR